VIDVFYNSFKQRLCPQLNRRIPEPEMVMSDMQQAREFARGGEEKSGLGLAYEFILLKLLQIAPKKGRVLDVACGSGVLLSKIALELPFLDFIGIDLSDAMIEVAKETLKKDPVSNVRLQKLDMFAIDTAFMKNCFDLITFNLALHQLSNETQAIEIINKMLSLLKENGVLFIYDLSRPKTDKIAVWFANRFNTKSGPYFYQDSLNSYRAAFSFTEMDEILKKSDWDTYEHAQPLVGNFFQLAHSNRHGRTVIVKQKSKLKTWEDKIFFFLLKTLPLVKC
jgi:arsenite methyltransferase